VSAPADQLVLFGGEEAVVVRRSARARRLSLRVFPHGVVEVVAPLRVGEPSIRQFVQSHAAWIARARGGFRALHGDAALAPPAELRLVALDERWEVDYVDGHGRLRAVAAPGGGRLTVPVPVDPQRRIARLRTWLMSRARATLLPWLEAVSAEVGLPYAGATVRRQRSRWGSCSPRHAISLNCALLFIEPALVRHLFLHELAHTRHLNHSPRFWRLVATLDPEFELREHALREAWRSVPAWLNHDPI